MVYIPYVCVINPFNNINMFFSSKALKMVLDLQTENVILKRAIWDAYIMLTKRKSHIVVRYRLHEAEALHEAVEDILSVLEKEQSPADKPNNPNKNVE